MSLKLQHNFISKVKKERICVLFYFGYLLLLTCLLIGYILDFKYKIFREITMAKKRINAEILIEDIEFPNKGIGFYESNKVYVKNTVPGQTVSVDIGKKRKKYEGRLIEITKNAEYEIQPECSVFGSCGGCTYQNVSYEKELEFKKNNVLKLLKNAGITDFEFLGIEGSPITEAYRNKMEFSFGDTGLNGELSLGMRKRNSFYEVENAGDCKIVDEDIRKIVNCVLEFFKNTNETFYHRKTKTGALRHLLVRKAYFTGEMLINIVTTSSIDSDLKKLSDKLININFDGKIAGITHIVNDSVADVVLADSIEILYGQDYFYEKLLGLKFKISVFSFFQTNSAGAEVLYSVIRNFAGDTSDRVIFDLYCGTGTIAQIIAPKAKKVIGIEIVPEAIEAAKLNAELNKIVNCEFIAGDVLKMVDDLTDKPDIIILDPPREGIHPKAINKIINFDADDIIYVSCKASSMVNDLQVFLDNGYIIKKIKCVDMFPRTYHVETICLLTRIN